MKTSFRQAIYSLFCGFSVNATFVSTLFAATLLFAIPLPVEAQVQPATYTVCPAGPLGCDYSTPEAAVNNPARVPGDTIDIVEGTYVLGATLEVNKSMTILGNDSVFDANGNRAIDVSGATTNFSLSSITIRNGQADAGLGGGAIQISDGATINVVSGIFENNQADFGGAIYNNGSTLQVNAAEFSGNRATNGDGGALFTDGLGISSLDRTIIDGNTASNAGGGVAVTGNDPQDIHARSQINLSRSTVSNNVALDTVQIVSNLPRSGTTISCGPEPLGQTFIPDEAALSAFEFDIRLNGPAFPGDPVIPNDLDIIGQVRQDGPSGPVIATAHAFAPGSFWAPGSTQTLTFVLDQVVALVPGDTYAIESAIAGAYSIYISPGDDYQGGSQYSCDDVLIPDTDFTFRTFGGTPGEGSGVHSSLGGHAGLVNTTVSGNVGDGVLATNGGIVSTWFNTITNNSGTGATAIPGEFEPVVTEDGLVFITATIIAGNGGDDCNGNMVTSGYNLIGDDTNCILGPTPIDTDIIGNSNVPVDPLLGPLQDNGGRTPTHAIDGSSPAFNAAGPDDSGLPCFDFANDQRDIARPNGPFCDIGAFEFAPPLGPLQTLINAAAAGATVNVPDGVYTEQVVIGNGKTLSGSGPDSVVIDASNLNKSAIIASGDFALIGIRVTGGNSATHGGAIFADIEGTNINLSNVVFDNNSAVLNGGAIYLPDGTLTGTNTTFTNNSAGGNGGTILSGNVADINSSLFNLNQAGDNGGAIAATGSLISSNNTFQSNNADRGGAISIEGGPLSFVNSSDDMFNSNTATRDGGAIYESASSLNVLRGAFQSNTAGDSNGGLAGDGGAIYSDRSVIISESVLTTNRAFEGDGVPGQGGSVFNNGTLTLVNSTIENSFAGMGGGLYNTINGIATISGTTLANNSADGSGTAGGAIGGAGSIEITNSTLSGNTTSGNGGGIGLSAGTANLNNVTLAFNSASGLGGPFYADPGVPGQPGALISSSNSLFSGNTGSGNNCNNLESLGYNLFQNAPCTPAASDIVSDPLIDFLASNGGPTQTHALDPISPARDAADPGQLVIELSSALSASQLTFNVDASEAGGVLIPVSGVFKRGSIFASAPDEGPFDLAGSFSTQFSFQITDPVAWASNPGEPSGDGFTFAIAASPTVIGEPGGRLGVATTPGPLGTVSVEFDTYRNGGDISTNAIGVNVGGFGNTSTQSVISAAQAAIPGAFDDGNVWTAWIDYRADSQRLAVRVAPDGVRPDLPQLTHTVDIAAEVGASGYYGFTGGTGLAHATHTVTAWEFFSTNCPTFDQRGVDRPFGTACDIGAVEGSPIPLALDPDAPVVLAAVTPDEQGNSFPGVVDVPIIDIPIEKLTGDVNNPPASAPLGSFPLGSFPIGSFDLRSSPIGSFPLGSFPIGSFPIGSFPIGSFPIGSFPLSSIPLQREGGWSKVLEDIPELTGAPLQTVTLEQVLTSSSVPDSVGDIELRDLAIQGSPLASLSLQGLSLGATTVEELDEWASNSGSTTEVCAELATNVPAFTDCAADDTLLSLEFKGAPVSALSLSSLPLGSFSTTAAPLGSFPIGSFPLGSFPLGSFPIGSFPIGSFPIGSFPLGSFPLGSFPIGSFPLGSFEVDGKPFCDFYDQQAGVDGSTYPKTCSELLANPATASLPELIAALVVEGASDISSTPLGSFPIGSFPIGSFPIGSFPLGSFPIGSFPIGSFPIGSFPIGSFPLGSFPIGSFPLGSFKVDGKPFCDYYDQQAGFDGAETCSQLLTDPATASLADLIAALEAKGASNIGSTPLGSFPIGSFPIGSFPIGSFPLGSFDLNSPPLSDLSLGDFDGCTLIASNSTDSCTSLGLSDSSTLRQVADQYGTLAASPLGSFPIGSFGIGDLPMGSFPIGSFEINGTPLGSFPLGSFDLINSPLGSFPVGSFEVDGVPLGSFPAEIVTDPTGLCDTCQTLADAARAGVLNPDAILADLEASSAFATVTLAEVMDAMTMATLYGDGTLEDIDDLGSLTLGQLLIAMMLKTDFPWETIPLEQLDAQTFSADNFVDYTLDIPLTGTESEPFSIAVNLADSFLYINGSALLDIASPTTGFSSASINDPVIIDNGDGTQTLNFSLVLGGFSNNRITFKTVPPLALGGYPATATVVLGSDEPVAAESTTGMVTIIPDLINDISDPNLAVTTPADILTLGHISTPDDIDFYRVAPPAAGDRVAVFMSNPAGDNDLIMYEPLSTVEAKGQNAVSAPLDSVPFEDDGVDYEGNISEEPNALEDVNLASAPLASISTNRGTLDESVSAIAGKSEGSEEPEPFTIQVSGYNGAVSDQPYTLRVKVTPQVPSPQCTARSWPVDLVSSIATAGEWTEETNAVFFINYARLAASETVDSTPEAAEAARTAADAALTAINSLVNAPGIDDGVVIDVSTIYGVDYSAWDANPCDVDAPNAIVNAITRYIEEQRLGLVSSALTYVTIVGSDEVIPFARKPDETSIANESTFAGEFTDNAMYGALVTRHFLSDDPYGDIDPIPWLDRYLNVPELGVGRLVESAADIQLAAENYLAFSGILDPQTALSAGYDFVADAAEDINDTFNAYSTELGYNVETALIDPPGITPETRAWSKADFLRATGISGTNPVDLVSFNMHFDFDEALPSIGDATGNYTDNLINTADLASSDLTGGIWFTVGCHSGSSVADVSVVGAPSEDWAQTFGRQGALYLAQNAYGLGDTEAVALTERLMANFASNLNGSLTIGQAHAFAKQQYFAGLGLYGEYDYKALQAATLYGLPMYQYGYGATVTEPPATVLPVSADPISGLESASWSVTGTGITQTTTDSKGELFSVAGEVQFVHFRPLQPIVRRDVTNPNGDVASGAFLTSLTTEDLTVMDMAFARPVIDLGENEPEIETDEVVFPTAFTNISNYKAPPVGGGPFEPRDQLNVIVGQFTSPLDGASSGTERLFRNFDAQVFYRPAPSALAAFTAAGEDFARPEFDNVQASVVGSSPATQAAFSVDVTDEGNVLRVAVLYLQSVTDGNGNWVLVDLVKGGGNTWTGGGPVDLSGIPNDQIDYMVQAVDDNGNVANSTFKGLFYVAETIPSAPDGEGPDDPFEVTLSDPSTNPPTELDNDGWNPVESIQVDVTTNGAVTYEYSVDGSRPLSPLGPEGFVVSGDGIHIVQLFGSDGSQETFVLLIDNTEPEIIISTPANNEYVVQGLAPPVDYLCRDSGSGTASCNGDVAVGVTVPDGALGEQTFSVNATDNAGLESGLIHTYYVVRQLDITGPPEPVSIGTEIEITATADSLGTVQYAVVEWGDGTTSTASDDVSQNGSTFTANHVYMNPGVYQITVRINDGGAYVQTGVFEFAVIYDPSSGFVTGGGWIDSPSGAYMPDGSLTGKAHFGFISKYKKGQSVPSGSTNFRFAAGDLEFESTSYDWMIISGARARYKGEGTVNGGAELYKFQVTALDADVSGAGITQDGFRIKIWRADSGDTENVLYDNGLGGDDATGNGGTTPLGGGSIKVHKAKEN